MVSLGIHSAAQSRASALLVSQQGAKKGIEQLTGSATATRENLASRGQTARQQQTSGSSGSNPASHPGLREREASVRAEIASSVSQIRPMSVSGSDVIDDASRRMNRDALIVFTLLGFPPEKARNMAEDLSDTASNIAPPDGLNTALRNFSRQSGNLSLVASSIELNFSQTNLQMASQNGTITGVSVTEFQLRIEQIRMEISNVTQQDPLILDLDGNGIDITSLRDGAIFDLDGDGRNDRVAWITGKDALLALDKNKNGKIDDGKELFGDQNGAKDGFAELATYDDNGDGTIDAQDRVFSSLILLHADGTQSSLADEGITSLRVSAITPLSERLIGGTLAAKGEFVRDDGSVGTTGEVLLDMQA
ncbi:hypothetical protein [Thalassospira profundimaris]|uniref:hypothetical protein n=1 Tax=Thalassospira profundimaris TaxID=502049 RepID=UPI000DEDADF5|nr:hypothetical protein [Thalassospira profundimaris]